MTVTHENTLLTGCPVKRVHIKDSEGNSVINIRFKNRSVTTSKTLEKQNESYQKNNKLIFVFSSIAEFLLDYINSEEFPELDNSIENIIIDLWNDD